MYQDYENDNMERFQESGGAAPDPIEESGEYAIRKDQNEGYSFGRYDTGERADTARPLQPQYQPEPYAEAPGGGDATSRQNRPGGKKRGGALRAVCLLLAALLVGGGAGVIGGVTVYNQLAEETAAVGVLSPAEEKDTVEVKDTAEADTSSVPVTSNVTRAVAGSGTALSGQEIYALGCQQVVGITSEITTTNIFGQTASGTVSGSGFIITEDGYILTNYHVVETAYKGGYDIMVMLNDGTSYLAELVGYEDDEMDVAVLKIDATGLTPASIGDSNDMQVGEKVYAIGNPLGELTYTMTDGIVSALDRAITFTDENTAAKNTINMFQTSAAVNSGNSGGPIYNERGEVIGIVTAKYDSTSVEGIGFAIPINDAVSIAEDLIQYGYVTGKPYFGIKVRTLNSAEAEYYKLVPGAFVEVVESGSGAEAAGLQAGDIITKLGDTAVASTSDLNSAKKQYSAGDTAKLTVYRNGAYLELTITFDEASHQITDSGAEEPQESMSGGYSMPEDTRPRGNG